MKISKQELNSIDMSKYSPPDGYTEYWGKRAGDEHYRLWVYLTSVYNNLKSVDLGGHRVI